jgi:6-phosphofructokinase 1
MIVETMGREAGYLALHAGIAGGADVILIPEIPYSLDHVMRHIVELRDKWGREFAMIIVAEGVKPNSGIQLEKKKSSLDGIGHYIAHQIKQGSLETNKEVRVTVLGHVQRGGLPSALDRLIAASFGKAAIDLIAQEKYDRMVAWQNGQVIDVSLEEVVDQSPFPVNPHSFLVQTAQALGIYVGDLL